MRTRLPIAEGAALPGLVLVALLATVLLAACSPSGAIFANAPSAAPSSPVVPLRSAAPGSVAATRATDPQPLSFPADDAPHDRLTEWWYYTGHLRADDGHRFGFEQVVFRAERSGLPVSWASHLALTDDRGRRFRYEQRTEIGTQVDRSTGAGFDLAIAGGGPTVTRSGSMTSGSPWLMRGGNGNDELAADADKAGFGLRLRLDARDRMPVLHDRIGYVDFGAAGGSYYYSRTRLDAGGTLTIDGVRRQVRGIAWFDHQWGDFIPLGAGGGWDWFAVNLADGTDLMISMIRDRVGRYPLAYAELVRSDTSHVHLGATEFSVRPLGTWKSAATGVTYPAGWRIRLPGEKLTIELHPTRSDQELDTRSSTGVIYWEGSQAVRATRAGKSVGGEAYVELTGYRAR